MPYVWAVVCGVFMYTSELGRTWTTDEKLHLVRGIAYLHTDDTRLNYAHPPLANAWSAMMISGVEDLDPPLQERRGWKRAYVTGVATDLLRKDGEAMDAWRTVARRTSMAWMIALVLICGWWTRRRFPPMAAFAATGFVAINPTLLAHARLCTTDLPLTVAATLTVISMIELLRRPRARAALSMIAATVLMICVKHSGIPLAVLAMLGVAMAAAFGVGGFAALSKGRRLRFVSLLILGGVVATILAINALYRFQDTGWTVRALLDGPQPHNWLSRRVDHDVFSTAGFGLLPEQWVIPLPRTYLAGLATVRTQQGLGHGGWFWGQKVTGHPLYFPVMLVAKLPATVVLLCAGGGLWRLRRLRGGDLTTNALILCAVIPIVLSMASRISIGVRHLLPVVPALSMLAGLTVSGLVRSWSHRPVLARAVTPLALTTVLAGNLSAWPHYLGFFSATVGGVEGGQKISVIGEDWGQNLGDLARHAAGEDLRRIYYYSRFSARAPTLRRELARAYEGEPAEVISLKCRTQPRRDGWMAIHLDDWVVRRSCFPWLGDREPDRTIADHIHLFHVSASRTGPTRR